MAKLIIRYPNNVINEVEFEQPKYTIGTAEDNDLVLTGDDVSPHQAEIYTADGAYSLVDVSENNNTSVNGKKVERVNITYGDRISFANVVGLFYPSKKGQMADRTKVILYLAAGAGVILVSIALIFFLTTRQISSVVSGGIGEAFQTDEVPAETVQEEPVTRRAREPRVRESGRAERPDRVEKAFNLNIFKGRDLELPQPPVNAVRKRAATAVPTGLRRLFFRKIPVPVVFSGETPVSAPADVPAAETAVQADTAYTGEDLDALEALPEEEKEGVFGRIASPFRRLFGLEEAVPLEADTGEEGPDEAGAEQIAVPASPSTPAIEPEKPSDEDVKRVTDPLEPARKRDIAGIREDMFEEKPVYSEKEIEQYRSDYSLSDIPVSASEGLNIDILWKYPEIPEETGSIIRSGAFGIIDDDKVFDYLYGTAEGDLVLLGGATGQELLREEMQGPFFEPVLCDFDGDRRDDILIIYESGDIEAMSFELDRLWYYVGADRITALPLLNDANGDGTPDIIFATFGMEIVAVDGTNGFELWRFNDIESEIIYPPVGVDINDDSIRDVAFVTVNGSLHAIDGSNGWGIWKRNIFGKPAGPCSAGDIDGDGEYDLVSLTRSGTISAYGGDGQLHFRWETQSSHNVPPTLGDTDGDGTVDIVLIDVDGKITAMEGATRREKWVYETEEGFSLARPALVDIDGSGSMDVIVGSASGALSIIEGESGGLLALFNSRGYLFASPVVRDINRDRILEILIANYGGEVYALQATDTRTGFFTLRRSSWANPHHDMWNTGFARRNFIVSLRKR